MQKLSKAGLLLIVFLLPWQTRWIAEQGMIDGNPNEYLSLSIYGADILLICVLLIKLYVVCGDVNFKFKISNFKSISNFKYPNAKKTIVLMALFLMWNALSIFWASDKILAVQHVVWLMLAVGLGWLVAGFGDKTRLIFWFCVGLVLPAWLAIWQFVTQMTFANKWLGLATHESALGGTSVVEFFSNGEPARWLRAYGSFDHPNILGAAMTIGILLAVAQLVQKKCKYAVFYYVALASMTAALLMSLSRSAWIGSAIGLVGMGWWLFRSRLRNSLRNYGKAIIVVGAVFAVCGFTYRDAVLVRADNDVRLEKKSLDDRVLYFQQAGEMIRQNPFMGVGAGNYVKTLHDKNPNDPAWTYQPVHDVFMLIWTELGIIGLLAFVVVYGTMAIRARKSNPLGFCLLFALLPMMILDHWLWSLHFGMIFFGLIAGIIVKRSE